MKYKTRDKFLPFDYLQTVFQKFWNLKQNNKATEEYNGELYTLQAWNGFNVDEE